MNSPPNTGPATFETAALAPARPGAGKRLQKPTLRLLAGGLALFLGLIPASEAAREDKTTLVFVNSKVADRKKFTDLIRREFRKASVLYTSHDSNADADVKHDVLFGIAQDNVKKYHTLVIISDFKNATVEYGNCPKAEAERRWMDTCASAKSGKATQLRLLSTSNDPPATYLCCVEVSGGEYRKLRPASSGGYE